MGEIARGEFTDMKTTTAPTVQDFRLQMAIQRQTMERLTAQQEQMRTGQMCTMLAVQQQQFEQLTAQMRLMQAGADAFGPAFPMDSDISRLSQLGRSMGPATFAPSFDPFVNVSQGRNANWGASQVFFGGDGFGGYQNSNFELDGYQEGYGSW